MARSGILYSHVAKAATKLVADGHNPTVDSVRHALGGTGSKSTIAPMLKRWKAEHQEQVLSQDVGLPTNLLHAIKALYEDLQNEAETKVEAAQHAAESMKESFEAQIKVMHAQSATLTQERDQLNEVLAQERMEYSQLEKNWRELQIAHTKIETEVAGMNQRLVDRQNEIDGLHRQLDQARTQFEHYQESIALQRSQERQQMEQDRLHIERDLTEARQTIATYQASLAQREADVTHLQQDKNYLSTELATLQSTHVALQLESRLQEQQIKTLSARQSELHAEANAMTDALAQAKSELAILTAEKPQLQDRFMALEVLVKTLREENKVLEIDKARLEGLHAQAHTHLSIDNK